MIRRQTNRLRPLLWVGLLTVGTAPALLAAHAAAVCVGDCNGDARVSIAEAQNCVNLAASLPAPPCAAADQNNDGHVDPNEVDACIQSFLNPAACPMVATPAATLTRPPNTNTPVATNTPLAPTGTASATRTVTRTGTATQTATPAPPTPTPTSVPTCPLAAGSYTTTQVGTMGSLKVYTFQAFPFPPGGSIKQDVKAATQPECVHETVVPFPGGFSAPIFCVPALGYMVQVSQRGCGIGKIDSNGGSDFTVEESNDTSDSSATCNLPNTGCPPGPAIVGADTAYRTDIKVGNAAPDTCASGGTMNALVSVPVHTFTWQDNSNANPWKPGSMCLGDGVFNTGDTVVTEFDQILDFTTDTAHASWVDLDGDGCRLAGAGPAAGQPPLTGRCIDTSVTPNTVTTAAAGGFGSGAFPNDGSFSTLLQNQVTPSGPLAGATCPSGNAGDEGPPIINFSGTGTRCIP